MGTVTEMLQVFPWWAIVRAVVFLVLGVVLARLAALGVRRALTHRFDSHQVMIARRVVFYGILAVAVGSALHQLGFQLGVLLGAAGVFSVAIAFASQTSASNLISGLFLVGERPFSVGDIIRVGATTGEVLSIDLLSVKLRTFDNIFVRLPNETLIKTEVATLTRFAIRRIDTTLAIAHHQDIERTREVMLAVADREPLCLEEPEPLFLVTGFGESGVNLQFSIWTQRDNLLEVRNRLHIALDRALAEAGIEIGMPRRALHGADAGRGLAPRSRSDDATV